MLEGVADPPRTSAAARAAAATQTGRVSPGPEPADVVAMGNPADHFLG